MKLKEAIEILIESSRCDLKGAGMGPGHRVPTGEKREQIEKAIVRAWRYVYGRDIAEHERYNMGLPMRGVTRNALRKTDE